MQYTEISHCKLFFVFLFRYFYCCTFVLPYWRYEDIPEGFVWHFNVCYDIKVRPIELIIVKKLHFIHMLTATDDRSSHIKNSKNKKSYITITLQSSYVNVQQFSKITFIFAVFDVRTAIICRR